MESTKHICLGIQSMLLGVPLLITRSKLQMILDIVGYRIGLDAKYVTLDIVNDRDKKECGQCRMANSDGIGVIPIHGTLTHRSLGLSPLSGLRSYQSIRQDFLSMLNDNSIHTILLDIDSPGGAVAGAFDLVDDIYNSRGRKPIYAFVNDSGYSAAYAIASAADHIYMTRTAGVGSIGVVMLHVDKSEQDAKAGIKYTPIYAGANKINGNPHAPLSKEAHTKAQSIVNQVYDLFVSTVARNNGLTGSEVRSTEADIYTGYDAIDRGLIDGILSYNELISMITQSKGGKPTVPNRNTTTPTKAVEIIKVDKKFKTDAEAPIQEHSLESPTNDFEINVGSAEPPQPVTGDVVLAAVEAERLRCTEILEACTIANCLDLASDMIANNTTADIARRTILTIMAERTQAQSIKSVVNPGKSATSNALLADAKKRAEN